MALFDQHYDDMESFYNNKCTVINPYDHKLIKRVLLYDCMLCKRYPHYKHDCKDDDLDKIGAFVKYNSMMQNDKSLKIEEVVDHQCQEELTWDESCVSDFDVDETQLFRLWTDQVIDDCCFVASLDEKIVLNDCLFSEASESDDDDDVYDQYYGSADCQCCQCCTVTDAFDDECSSLAYYCVADTFMHASHMLALLYQLAVDFDNVKVRRPNNKCFECSCAVEQSRRFVWNTHLMSYKEIFSKVSYEKFQKKQEKNNPDDFVKVSTYRNDIVIENDYEDNLEYILDGYGTTLCTCMQCSIGISLGVDENVSFTDFSLLLVFLLSGDESLFKKKQHYFFGDDIVLTNEKLNNVWERFFGGTGACNETKEDAFFDDMPLMDDVGYDDPGGSYGFYGFQGTVIKTSMIDQGCFCWYCNYFRLVESNKDNYILPYKINDQWYFDDRLRTCTICKQFPCLVSESGFVYCQDYVKRAQDYFNGDRPTEDACIVRYRTVW